LRGPAGYLSHGWAEVPLMAKRQQGRALSDPSTGHDAEIAATAGPSPSTWQACTWWATRWAASYWSARRR